MGKVLTIALLAACLPAHAALEDVAGANYSHDSSTGLYWLDVKETVGQSFDQVKSGDLAAHGWRYATTGEVGALFASNVTTSPYGVGVTPLADSLGGWTQESFGGPPKSWELVGIFDAGAYRSTASLYTATCGGCSSATIGTESISDSTGFLNPTFQYAGKNGGTGSFLVSTVAPVPEPGTYALMGLGLLGLLVAKRRAR